MRLDLSTTFPHPISATCVVIGVSSSSSTAVDSSFRIGKKRRNLYFVSLRGLIKLLPLPIPHLFEQPTPNFGCRCSKSHIRGSFFFVLLTLVVFCSSKGRFRLSRALKCRSISDEHYFENDEGVRALIWLPISKIRAKPDEWCLFAYIVFIKCCCL